MTIGVLCLILLAVLLRAIARKAASAAPQPQVVLAPVPNFSSPSRVSLKRPCPPPVFAFDT